jgi:hypothetical protein
LQRFERESSLPEAAAERLRAAEQAPQDRAKYGSLPDPLRTALGLAAYSTHG